MIEARALKATLNMAYVRAKLQEREPTYAASLARASEQVLRSETFRRELRAARTEAPLCFS